MNIKFLSLGSGSSGNCYYLGTDTYSILIDAGVGIRTIKKIFKEYSLSLSTVRAVFITHDHADHIKAAGHLAGKHNIPVYSTPEVHRGMRRSYCMTDKIDDAHAKFIHKGETITVEDFEITCFEVPHDGTDNVGYTIRIDGKTFSFLTDIGHITETAAAHIIQSNYLVLEANYDKTMLQIGPYPQYLKERIAGPNGHLCNADAAQFLAENYPQGLKYLWLCHLSKDNNHPELALKTVEMALAEKGIVNGRDLEIISLRRVLPTGPYILE